MSLGRERRPLARLVRGLTEPHNRSKYNVWFSFMHCLQTTFKHCVFSWISGYSLSLALITTAHITESIRMYAENSSVSPRKNPCGPETSDAAEQALTTSIAISAIASTKSQIKALAWCLKRRARRRPAECVRRTTHFLNRSLRWFSSRVRRSSRCCKR